MANVLESIMEQRRKDMIATRRLIPVERLQEKVAQRPHHSLVDRLRQRSGTQIIAEMKKASPSAGILRPDYRPGELAAAYAGAGAAALSVLTEPHRFLGSLYDVVTARKAVDVPILRKDFTCDAYQVYETAACGADVILLIVAALEPARLKEYYELARTCRLDVLVEAHTAPEVEAALALPEALIGVNSRNLKTLKTDLAVARDLARLIPRDRLSVAESGIRTRTEIEELEALGYAAFLIGESVVTSHDPAAKLRELLGHPA